MNAHLRPLLGAIVAIPFVLTNAAAQGPPVTVTSSEQFAAGREQPVLPIAPIPAPTLIASPQPLLAVPDGIPPPGWVSLAPKPGILPPGVVAFIPPSLGFRAMRYHEVMPLQGRELSPAPNYGNLFDRQTPLPRSNNDFFDRPMTSLVPMAVLGFGDASPGSITAGGTVRGDAVSGSAQLPSATQFVPSAIPVKGDANFGLPARATVETVEIGTHLFLDTNVATAVTPTVRVFTQLNGFTRLDGSTGGRMPHLFGQLKDLVVGKADTFFSDPDAFPNTIDLRGPNALVYVQHLLIGYTFAYQWGGTALETGLSIELPEPSVTPPDPENATEFTSRSQIPDLVARARIMGRKWGHVQLASIVRSIGIENQAYETGTGSDTVEHSASHQEVFGWGILGTGMVQPFGGWDFVGGDLFGFGGMCGRGISEYNLDLRPLNGLDAMFDDKDQLRALPLTSFFLSYTHLWTPKLRSTVVYSQVDLKSFDSPDLEDSPYRRGRYFAANLIYEWNVTSAGSSPEPGTAFTGIEYLFGRKELLDGSYGDAHRVQFTAGARY
jgi:hypothetical protein